MNQQLYRLVFAPSNRAVSLGELIRRAKATTRDADIRRTWMLLGDPTMKLR